MATSFHSLLACVVPEIHPEVREESSSGLHGHINGALNMSMAFNFMHPSITKLTRKLTVLIEIQLFFSEKKKNQKTFSDCYKPFPKHWKLDFNNFAKLPFFLWKRKFSWIFILLYLLMSLPLITLLMYHWSHFSNILSKILTTTFLIKIVAIFLVMSWVFPYRDDVDLRLLFSLFFGGG